MPIPSRPSPDPRPKLPHDDIVELGEDDIVLLEDDGDDGDDVVAVESVEATVARRGARDGGDDSPRSETRSSKPVRLGRRLGRLGAIAGGALLFLAGVLLVVARSEGARRARAPREAVVVAPTEAPVTSPPRERSTPPPRAARAASVTDDRVASAAPQPERAVPAPEVVAERATDTTPAPIDVHPGRSRLERSATRRARLAARIEPTSNAPAASDVPAAAEAPAPPEPAPPTPAAPTAAAPPSPTPGSADLPTLPSRSALRVALTSATTALRACTSHRGVAMMTLTLGGDGSVRSAAPAGSWGGHLDRACVERAMARVRVPAFTRPSFTLRFPFVL
jgi:cytoskeletal protein RodZ